MTSGAIGAGVTVRFLGALLILALLATPRFAAPTSAIAEFTPDEVARILSHGPWPSPGRVMAFADPTNRFSGDPAAIALGRRLFHDARLSRDGALSCASCHDPARDFTDGRARAVGLAPHDRNTQSLLNVGLQRWFGWDGGADSLWAASIRPLLAPAEMGSSAAKVAAVVRGDPDLAAAHAKAFGPAPPPSSRADEALMVDVAKAIAAWMETLVSPRTAFDAFRDALARGDAIAASHYPADARRGLAIFIGRGNCSVCHHGPAFSNGEFHDIGIPFVVGPGRVDPGRHAGIRRLREDPFNLLGRWNDETAGASARSTRTRHLVLQHRNWGEWRTPGLRGAARTAPYMHDGRLATLRDVVQHYARLDEDRLHSDGEALLKPLNLKEDEVDDLVAFLRSLDPLAPPER